jgi:Zn-dependent protease with chaperone function
VTKRENDEEKSPEMERYTIFHALFEAMKEKDKKHKRRWAGRESFLSVIGSISNHLEAKKNLSTFKALFIADPGHAETDAITINATCTSGDQKFVQEIMSRKLATMDRTIEIFSTHPNIIKRLKALRDLDQS